jgi:hypothetical protein
MNVKRYRIDGFRRLALVASLGLGVVAAASLVACGEVEVDEEPSSRPQFTVGVHSSGIRLGFVGHEVLTRMAVQAAGKHIKSLGSVGIREGKLVIDGVALEDDMRASGFQSLNPLVLGNVHTDVPGERDPGSGLPDLVGVFEREFGILRSEDWHGGDKRQQTHFLRDFSGSVIESARDACEGALAKVARLSELSVERMKAGDARGALYMAGSSLHTLQDSFSAAHAPRDASHRRLLGVCTFDREATTPDVCFHKLLAVVPGKDDSIWRSFTDVAALPKPDGGETLALKPTAVAAARYSAGYLRLMSHLYASSDAPKAAVESFFQGKSPLVEADAQGAWDCSTLSDDKGKVKP